MKNFMKILTLAVVLLAVSVTAFAQVQPTFTTLSSAISDERATRMIVASATGFTASNSAVGTDYYAFIDHELVRITAVSGTTITIQRGQSRTGATPHASGAHVFVGVAPSSPGPAAGQSGGPFISNALQGSCTRGNYGILPLIQVNPNALGGAAMYNCNGGVWLQQTLPDDVPTTPLSSVCTVPIGSVAYASLGTVVADTADKQFRASIFVPYTAFFTGIKFLAGTTATTDNVTSALFSADGKRIASSAAAGALLSGASTFQTNAFALNRNGAAQTTTLVTGPAMYFVTETGNGSAAGAYAFIAASTYPNVVTGSATSQTFGTWPDFTAPTTFTADVGPISCLYK